MDRKPKHTKQFKLFPTTQNTYATSKYINKDTTIMQTNLPCLQHVSEVVTHFCTQCMYRPLCGKCIQQGSHNQHSIKNTQKTSKIVHRLLNEALITFRAKQHLLEILQQQIGCKKIQLKTEFKQYIDNIQEVFNQFQSAVTKVKRDILQTLRVISEKETTKIEQIEHDAIDQNEKIKTVINIISEKAENLQAASLCFYYFEKKQTLESMMQETQTIYEQLKLLVPDFKFGLNHELLNSIQIDLQNIYLKVDQNSIEIQSRARRDKLRGKFKKTQSSKNLEVLNLQSHDPRVRTAGYWTPKNFQTLRVSKNLMKSIKSSKNLIKMKVGEDSEKYPKTTLNSKLLKKVKHKIEQ